MTGAFEQHLRYSARTRDDVFTRANVDEEDIVPNRRTGITFLMVDGDLAVPGGRYGTHTSDCAPVAWRLAYLLARDTGEPITYRDLDHAMGLVVNSHDDVAYIVNTFGDGHYT